MSFSDLYWLKVLLRVMVYIGTIAVAGSVFVRITLTTTHISKTINAQIVCGLIILLLCEPLRYLIFQLSITQGDWVMAFDPAMRWIGFETPIGQASGLRLIGAGIVIISFLGAPVALIGAFLIVGSYLIEGHTILNDKQLLLQVVLFIHLAVIHWWLGVFIPLQISLASKNFCATTKMINDFSNKAVTSVVVLFIAGIILLGELSNWELRFLESAYQQIFFIKICMFAVILSIAAINKLWWTPLFLNKPHVAQRGLRTSINIEIVIATSILIATAIATSSAPSG